MICGEALPSLRTSSIQESRSSSEFQKQHEAQCQPSVKSALSELGAVALAAAMKEGDDSPGSSSSSSTITSCSTSNVCMATHQASQSLQSLRLHSSSRFRKEKAVHGAAACDSEDVRDLQEELQEFAYVKWGTREVREDSAARWLSLPVDLPYHAPRVWL